MKRVSFYIDGLNLYHSINDIRSFHKYKWLDIKRFCASFIRKDETISRVKYFTSYAHHIADSYTRHKIYIKALQLTDIDIIFGRFGKKTVKCKKCRKEFYAYEEKRIDVEIAVNFLADAINDHYDKAFILSGDSDLVPAIKLVRQNCPEKELGVIIPISRQAEELKLTADSHMKVKEKHLKTSQLEDSINIEGSNPITRPSSWN
jgi:uncharacterized LabA/DUF88 family protein